MRIALVLRNAKGEEVDREVFELPADDEGGGCRAALVAFATYGPGVLPGDTIVFEPVDAHPLS